MEKYINPLSDFGFKKLFGSEQSKDLLISFLNDLLDLEYEIIDLKFINIEIHGQISADRKSLFDIYCTDANNTIFIVELQKANQQYLKDRMIYYASTAIVDQANKGEEWNYQLPKLYSIAIANFKIFDDSDYLREGLIINKKNHQIIYDKLNFVFLEIPKFHKKPSELNSHLDKWIYFIKNLNKDESIFDLFQHDLTIQKSFEIAKVSNLNPVEFESYKASVKEINDRYSEIVSAKLAGRLEGEFNKALETAKNFLKMGLSTEQVCQGTGLTEQQLKENNLI